MIPVYLAGHLILKKFTVYHIGFILFGLALLVACSQTKNTFVTRTYHNITSRYNGFFYAKESMKDAMQKIEKSYVDDYSQLLPMFRLPNTPETKAAFSDLEKAIKKSTSVIDHHAIVKKGTDPKQEIPGAVKWIDDNYLIIGQAYYYKGEYLPALDIFDYIIQKYKDFPIRFDAIMWKARTQVELGAYTEAETLLDMIASDKACPEKLIGDIKASYADLYMRRGNYLNAIKYLGEAIPLTKKKSTRARYTFILAQLNEMAGNEQEAYKMYAKVIDMHPPYDMLFNSKLNRARLSAHDPENRAASKKELLKMLTDIKNTEYRDQIYYTLAQLETGAGNEEGAVKYYKLSIATSAGNNKQKALSYLALGDLHFTRVDYIIAQKYYDSTMMYLPKDYAGYDAIEEKKKSLTTLVRYLEVVQREDSLQNIVRKYGTDTTVLYPFIDKLIAREVEAEKRRKEEEEEQMNKPKDGPVTQTGTGQQVAGAWYFYNAGTISFGLNEFTRKWGTRKLEDNWRRSNKESIIVEEGPEGDGQDTLATAGGPKNTGDKFTRAYYLKNLPLSSAAIIRSDSAIADAYYNLGTIFKEQMHNNPKAIEAFETLVTRYPKSNFALPSHFQLVRLYTAAKKAAKAEEHKNYICTNFPASEYCVLLDNPNHEVELFGNRKKISEYYDSTYSVYQQKNYYEVLARCNYAETNFGNKLATNEHAAKFSFLRAVSLGKTQGNAAMEAELIRLITSYPKDPVRPQAQALLDAMQRLGGGSKPASDTVVASTGPEYIYNETTEYQYMVVVETGKGNLNQFRIALSDFNTEMFASSTLAISSIPLDAQHMLVMVKKFQGKTKVMEYYNLLKGRPDIFAALSAGAFDTLVISTENFSLLLKDKKLAAYKTFFEKYFVEKK
ncbi:MAG TPA: tetratricopeptide repeat protein [Bacteroidia bacterium]|nr:tetratricopeptide repeat protein [Bacteroidia bacterium]